MFSLGRNSLTLCVYNIPQKYNVSGDNISCDYTLNRDSISQKCGTEKSGITLMKTGK